MNKQHGFTLVELLVALLIGLLLTAAIIVIYAGSQSTFRASQGVSRSQEATRFAVHFLKTDIRQAGYNGCSEGVSKRSTLNQFNANYIPSYEGAVFGWDFNGTNAGETVALNYQSLTGDFTDTEIQNARDANAGDVGDWAGQTVRGSGGAVANATVNLPPLIQALGPLAGSDIIAVSIAEPLLSNNGVAGGPSVPVYIQPQTNKRSPTLLAVDGGGNAILTGVASGGIITVGDCSSIDTFQNSAAQGNQFFSALPSGALSPDNALAPGFGWQKTWDESAQIFQQTTSVYFVGTGASGSPSLFRYSSNCGLVDPAIAPAGCQVSAVELVEGVENMQAKYAEDTDNDGVPDQVLSANQVVDFNNVLSVELGLLVRSVDSGLEIANAGTYVLAGDTKIDPPNDRFQRFVSNTSIRLHNRGL